jgi:glycine amidinotransferase
MVRNAAAPIRVSSYNEWDPLEEVVVGIAEGAVRPAYEPALAPYVAPSSPHRCFRGGSYPSDQLAKAQRQLDAFALRLEREGITVRRPDRIDHSRGFATPDFSMPMGHGQTCPRDVLLVVGDNIIEAPMAQRARFFEYRAYRSLLREYFKSGARWTAAPRPLMDDSMYVSDYTTEDGPYDLEKHPNLTERDPCFDAACFARVGRDIFWQPDVVSNETGAAWLQQHLGSDYRIHKIQFADAVPQHIDTTLVPLRPGLVVTNPERPCSDATLDLFLRNDWRVVEGPPSVREGMPIPARDVSNWISLNFLSLDPHTVIAEAAEEPLHSFLRQLDCEVIPMEFDAVFQFGGSFHCCTADIRRQGTCESYFPSLGS